ncbi:MAG TPA: kelch repeat-containing protein, partial [Terriglobales bacterium]|nr:kelch repeat-containing protein [Terriglobales bacterium]
MSTISPLPRLRAARIARSASAAVLLLSLLACGAGHGSSNGGGGTGTGGGGGNANFVVLISGGQQNSNAPTSNAALYDLSSNSISSTGAMVDGRAFFTLTLLSDGSVLAAGGDTTDAQNTAEIYAPTTGAFR